MDVLRHLDPNQFANPIDESCPIGMQLLKDYRYVLNEALIPSMRFLNHRIERNVDIDESQEMMRGLLCEFQRQLSPMMDTYLWFVFKLIRALCSELDQRTVWILTKSIRYWRVQEIRRSRMGLAQSLSILRDLVEDELFDPNLLDKLRGLMAPHILGSLLVESDTYLRKVISFLFELRPINQWNITQWNITSLLSTGFTRTV